MVFGFSLLVGTIKKPETISKMTFFVTYMEKFGSFYPEEIEKLTTAYREMKEIKSEGNGSAYGEHLKLAKILRECGVHDRLEDSATVEWYIEEIITYGRTPQRS